MEWTTEPGFRRRIAGAFGSAGRVWLEALPTLVESCARRWSLSRIEPFSELSYAWVARARRNETPVVLKISVPGFESQSEILALETFPSGIACGLYEADPEVCAILMEDLMPGTTLHTVTSLDERVEIAREIFARLHRTPADSSRRPDLRAFPSFASLASRALGHVTRDLSSETANEGEWRPRLHAIALIALKQLEALANASKDVASSDGASLGNTLIHGDLHHGNILRSAERWRLIDPKGIAGPLWLEPARFMLNQYEAAPVDARHSQFDRMTDSFASALGLRSDLVALGAMLDAAVSASWSWEDGAGDQEMLQAVERAETIGEYATRRGG